MKTTVNKQEIIDWITNLDDEALLVTLQSMKNKAAGDFWNDLSDVTKQAINKAKTQLDEGKGSPTRK